MITHAVAFRTNKTRFSLHRIRHSHIDDIPRFLLVAKNCRVVCAFPSSAVVALVHFILHTIISVIFAVAVVEIIDIFSRLLALRHSAFTAFYTHTHNFR